jgi:hypothetical protein
MDAKISFTSATSLTEENPSLTQPRIEAYEHVLAVLRIPCSF